MHDTNSIAMLLAVMAALTLLTGLWRGTKRRVLGRRLRRSLRLAVGGELGRAPRRRYMLNRASRPVPGPGGADMAA
jgi:hypothetical protein